MENQPFKFWDRKVVQLRLEDLDETVIKHLGAYSAYRFNEAFYLILTTEEQREYRALEILLERL